MICLLEIGNKNHYSMARLYMLYNMVSSPMIAMRAGCSRYQIGIFWWSTPTMWNEFITQIHPFDWHDPTMTCVIGGKVCAIVGHGIMERSQHHTKVLCNGIKLKHICKASNACLLILHIYFILCVMYDLYWYYVINNITWQCFHIYI